jgi:hypothetical protein
MPGSFCESCTYVRAPVSLHTHLYVHDHFFSLSLELELLVPGTTCLSMSTGGKVMSDEAARMILPAIVPLAPEGCDETVAQVAFAKLNAIAKLNEFVCHTEGYCQTVNAFCQTERFYLQTECSLLPNWTLACVKGNKSGKVN